MTVLLLPPRFTEDSISIARAASKMGWSVERLSSWHIPPLLAEEDVCLYAEPLFAIHAASHLNLNLIEPTYDWLASLPPQWVRREVKLMRMDQARSIADRRFVKCAGEKFFTAALYDNGKCLPSSETVGDMVPVLVIEPVEWEVEFRCFVLDRKVVASSPYLNDGELAKDADDNWIASDEDIAAMTKFTQEFLGDIQVNLPPAVVIDLGRIRDRGWAVVEANPAWGSGLYGCNPAASLAVVRRSCVKSQTMAVEDSMWVIDHAQENFL